MSIRPILIAILTFLSFSAKAQYPFEKFTPIQYRTFKDWKATASAKDSLPENRTLTILNFKNNTTLKITQDLKISLPDSLDYSELSIYIDDKRIKEFEVGTKTISDPLPVFVSDINGDGLDDLKIIFPNYGCGAFNYYCQTVYLFQDSNANFKEIIFTDMFEEFENRPERDFNNDGNYEIITQL